MSANANVFGDGIYTPVTTFFKENYDLDLNSQVKHAKHLYSNGISGLLLSGSIGESIHLSTEERVKLISAIRDAIPDKNFILVSGMPYTNVADALKEIELVRKAGGDFAILHVPGFYGTKLTPQQGIIDYFHAIADKSTLPLLIYHYPGVSNGLEVSTETFEVLAKHPKIVGVKMTHFNLDNYILLAAPKAQNVANNFKPFTGLGQILIPALSVGAFGAIDGLSGIFPKVMVRLFQLFRAGELDQALKLQYLVTRADRMIFDLNLAGVKHVLYDLYGYGSKNVSGRPPLNNLIDDSTWAKYDADFKELAAVESTL
ncbi:Piso0_001212 [Millerozyma farinosa CBS 7064]|uniref:Piso0_001212 protein n=1 Tax=Pichia sorbitophila (strain ATCC MYA-4447 / BCRC 22081 / CBS 7064 / NBRC 10061 / NRRL Y-12695) TaxID=559304 RepID=G8YMK3_PICSO|nr:Piso0_001212 [Millerozyma farinosa CBS 7064]